MKYRDCISGKLAALLIIMMSICEVFFGYITYMAYQESIDLFGRNKLETSNPDKIPEFYFDELAAFGSKEVQEFGAGGVAYEK